jgi:hypothetical protein
LIWLVLAAFTFTFTFITIFHHECGYVLLLSLHCITEVLLAGFDTAL